MKGKIRIINKINELVGKQVGKIGRASSMCWMGFGELIEVPTYKGRTHIVEEYALNIQCPWRIRSLSCSNIIIASADIFEPPKGVKWEAGFNWDIQGGNLFDEKVKGVIEDMGGAVVQSIELNDVFDLKIIYSNQLVLECFINLTSPTECWCFFRDDAVKHMVVTGQGIEP